MSHIKLHEPGAVVALRYRIVSHLGTGGMAHVYRAIHLGLRRPVALKILAPEPAATPFGDRFEREARAAARLHHPGCVRVFDYGRWVDGSRYLAMELVEGPTLRQLLVSEGPLPPRRAVRIATEVLKALTHAHRHGVLHRDIKPENVMFTTRDGASRPILIDFGLARLRGEGPLTAAGFCIGSPSYLAPERLLGRPYDARADVYAVGVMLYELLSGQRPFCGRTPHEIAWNHIAHSHPPLVAHGVTVPPSLAALIDRALAKEPARRFADSEQMLAAIEQVPELERRRRAWSAAKLAEDEPTTALVRLAAPRSSLPRRAWAWMRFGRWRWRTAAAR